MQIGSYIFNIETPERVFIQVAGDGEGGYFNISALPNVIRVLLGNSKVVENLTERGHAEADTYMNAFWKKHF